MGLNQSGRTNIHTISLLAMLAGTITCKLGLLFEEGGPKSLMRDAWNFFDLCSIELLGLWAAMIHSEGHQVSRQILLSLSLVPSSIGLLEYFCYFKQLGPLVLMIFAMVFDLVNFFIIYVMFTMAFGLCLWALFPYTGSEGFGNLGFTFINLFAAMQGGTQANYLFLDGPPLSPVNVTDEYEANYFDQIEDNINNTGIVVFIAFVTLMGIVLVNLLVARMTSTHDNMQRRSKAVWGFTQVLPLRGYCI